MRIIDRYLIRGFIQPLLFCVTLFTILFVIVDIFNNLDDYLRKGVTLWVILSYYTYLFPVLLVQIVPVATLFSILYVLGNLNKHHEVIALKASGISAFHILSPYLFTGMLISFSIFLVNETVIPHCTITSRSIMDGLIQEGKKNIDERAIKNVTLYGAENRMIYAREYELQTQTLHDVVILQNNEEQLLQSKLTAKKAKYDNGSWTFTDAMRYRLNRRGEMIGDPDFNTKLTLEMPERPSDFIHEASQVEFMSARDLKKYIGQVKGGGKKLIRRLWVDYHYKVAVPFLSFIVMLIGAPLAMRPERGSPMLGVGTCLLVILMFYAVDSICLALGKGGYLPPFFAAWFSHIVFGIAGIYLIKKTA